MAELLNPLYVFRRDNIKNFKELSHDLAKHYLNCVYIESKGVSVGLEASGVCSQIINKRIEVLKLPIKFSPIALYAAHSLHEGVAGRAVIILIDCLCKYKDEEVTVEKLTEVYPFGFYNENTFIDYVDNYLKTRKTMWSEIY